MKRTIALVAVLQAISGSGQVLGKEVESLPFVGKWNLKYDTNSCHLTAAFGDGNKQVAIMLTRYGPGDELEMMLAGPRFGGVGAKPEVTTDFASDGSFTKSVGLSGKVGNIPMIVVGNRELLERDGFPPPITPEQETSVHNVTVRVARSNPFKLETGTMGKAMKAMRTCTDSLVKSWGYEPEAAAALARPPVPKSNPLKWLLPSDYPPNARFQGANGLVHVMLDVEADGSIRKCRILSEFKPADFGVVTCKAIRQRGAFSPAMTRSGQPVRSFYLESVKWIMP